MSPSKDKFMANVFTALAIVVGCLIGWTIGDNLDRSRQINVNYEFKKCECNCNCKDCKCGQ